jgi:tetratricopeptide (TPR) repeat protein
MFVGVWLVSRPARADEAPNEAAAAAFAEGVERYERGEHRGALESFTRAHELSPNWRVLYNIGQMHLELGHDRAAHETLTRYLAEGSGAIDELRLAQVNHDLQELRGRLSLLAPSVEPRGASVVSDGASIGSAPVAAEEPAARVIAVPTPLEGDPPPAADAAARVPWAAWAISAGLGVGALTFGLLAVDAGTNFDAARERATTKDELESERATLLGFAIAADALTVATLVAGGVAIYLTLDRDDDVAVAWMAGGAAVRARF